MSHIAIWLIGLWLCYMWAVWIFGCWFDLVASKNMRSDPFPSEVSYDMAKGIVEILFAFPSLHS